MKKEYILYLDESGDFDKDLDAGWKNECLVGGFLCEKNDHDQVTEKMAADLLKTAYLSVYPECGNLKTKEIIEQMNHSTSLSLNKARLSTAVLSAIEKKAEFIIFENFNKSRIVNSTKTYLNIMVDGIVQLLNQLIITNNGNPVFLDIIVGSRRDTAAADAKTYISLKEYTDRLTERLECEKVKYHHIRYSRSKTSIRCDNDKANCCLILCDYICNFYITRTAKEFSQEYQNGMTYREFLESKYKPEYHYHLNGSVERDRVLNHINSHTYDAALFDICTGIIKESMNIKTIIDDIKTMEDREIDNILSGFSYYMKTIIDVDRNTTSSLEYLDKALAVAQELMAAGKKVSWFVLDIKLYQLAVYDHLGNLEKMDIIFEESRPLLKRLLASVDHVEYAFIYLNRYAVYLFDIFEVQRSFDLLETIRGSFDAYELLLESLPELDLDKTEFKALQLGKILGTQAQCARYLLGKGEMSYQEACSISDAAMDNFDQEFDMRRQYQYRAQIEAENGTFEKALAYYCKGFGLNQWEDIFINDEQKQGRGGNKLFGFYHLSFIMRKMAKIDAYKKVAEEMVKKFRANEKRLMELKGFPTFITEANIAKVMIDIGYNRDVIRKYYTEAISYKDNPDITPLFMLMTAMIDAEYIGYLIDAKTECANEKKSLYDLLKAVMEAAVPENLKALCLKYQDLTDADRSDRYYEFSALLQY